MLVALDYVLILDNVFSFSESSFSSFFLGQTKNKTAINSSRNTNSPSTNKLFPLLFS
jgi:hypothetical protein